MLDENAVEELMRLVGELRLHRLRARDVDGPW